MQLVYYSLASLGNPTYERQWTQSARSLRSYNKDVAVHLFVYGPATDALLLEADRLKVTVHQCGDYHRCLQEFSPGRAAALAHYPVLHKFLSLRPLIVEGASRILYLDCDTYFFGDVERLFQRYRTHDFYAREEPWSRLSHYGYRAAYLDEDCLRRSAFAEGLAFVPPYNTGVCLFNNHLGRRLAAACPQFLRYAWRLLVGMSYESGRRRGEPARGSDLMEAVRLALRKADLRTRLPYPSSNKWIVEEIALLLTLGGIAGVTHHHFSREDAEQNGEFEEGMGDTRPVLAHYYSSFEGRFFARVKNY